MGCDVVSYIPPRLTPLGKAEAWEIVARELAKRGIDNDTSTALALAQLDVETAGFVRMWNFNPGNVKNTTMQGDFTCIRLNERIDGKIVWFAPEGQLSGKGGEVVGQRWKVPPGHPQTRIRAFDSAEEGIAHWASLLERRYPAAWAALQEGDLVEFNHGLKLGGYYTAKEAEYLPALRSRVANWTPYASPQGTAPERVARQEEQQKRPDCQPVDPGLGTVESSGPGASLLWGLLMVSGALVAIVRKRARAKPA